MDARRDQAAERDSQDLARQMDEVAAGISSITENWGVLAEKLAAFQAALQLRLEELSQREARLSDREADLADREASVAAREADLERQSKELADAKQELEVGGGEISAWQQELEQMQSALEARAAELEAAETRLAAREEAVRKFQATLAGLMQAFGTAVPSDLMQAQARLSDSSPDPAPVASEDPPPEPPAGDEAEPDLMSQVIEPSDDATALPECDDAETEGVPEPGVEEEAQPERAEEHPAAAEHEGRDSAPEGDGSPTAEDLDEDTRQKLKVLRRLTGGRVSDEELLERISHERQGSTDDSTAGKKRRWW